MTWSNKNLYTGLGGTFSVFLPNSSQVLTILGKLNNDGIVNVNSGSLVLDAETGMFHRGNFIYALESSLKFQGNHTFGPSSNVQGGPNLTFTNGKFDFNGNFLGINGYIHGPNSLVIFYGNVTFDYPMVVSSGGLRLLGLIISFLKGLTLSVGLFSGVLNLRLYIGKISYEQ